MKINQSLMDAHLVGIKSLGTVTTRGFSSSNSEDFGRQTNGAFDFELLFLGSLNQIIRDFFKIFDVSGSERDSWLLDGNSYEFCGFWVQQLLRFLFYQERRKQT